MCVCVCVCVCAVDSSLHGVFPLPWAAWCLSTGSLHSAWVFLLSRSVSQSAELFNTDFRRLTSWLLLRHLGEEAGCWNVDWPMSVYTRACQRVDVRVGGVCSFELVQQRQVDADDTALTETESAGEGVALSINIF